MASIGTPAGELIARAESFENIRAGIARLEEVLNGPSYQVVSDGRSAMSLTDDGPAVAWPPGARTVLVLGFKHPDDEPRLDWWARGNTPGNRRLMAVSESLTGWLKKEYGLKAHPLPYDVERGGLFLKDAAVLAGLGVVGRNNLLIHPEWGAHIRLRSVLIEVDWPPTGPVGDFSPCDGCGEFCRAACPRNAFIRGSFHRPSCILQLDEDTANKEPGVDVDGEGNPVSVIKYCRACELACPFGT